MYVCVCNAVTDKQIVKATRQGACSMRELREQLNVGTCCGRCNRCAKQLLRETINEYEVLSPAPLMPATA